MVRMLVNWWAYTWWGLYSGCLYSEVYSTSCNIFTNIMLCAYFAYVTCILTYVRCRLRWKTVVDFSVFFVLVFCFVFFGTATPYPPNFLTKYFCDTILKLIEPCPTLDFLFLDLYIYHLSAMKPSMFMLLTYTLATGVLLLQGKL